MKELQNKNEFSSIELVSLINTFRKEENKSELKHKSLLSLIREELAEQNILPGSYKDKQNQSRPMYILTSNQAKQILVKESRTVRRKVIEYIEKLENGIEYLINNPNYQPKNFNEALLITEKQRELIEIKDNQIKEKENTIHQLNEQKVELEEKSKYMDLILNSKETMITTQIAQEYGMSAIALNKLLRDLKIQYFVNGQWILMHNYVAKGYVTTKTHIYYDAFGKERSKISTVWTQKGRKFIYETLKKYDILPLIEKEDLVWNKKEKKQF